ncbi:TPA: tyrosine-protein kinase, partial [Klebsiella pneumoniae]|nr:tyrosine-protein kinase [Klebsiella pneumoniae]HBS2113707.1 tyrosine-protein kinase [Klebsiella pneumoniae]HBV6876453.1 tyrosine-protein kinase [Klebsiella pneumoniae]
MSSLINKTSSRDSEGIDLGRLLGEFIDHRKLIISVTSLCTLIALIYAIFATPIYQADALIQVEQKQGNAILSNLSQMLPDSQPQSAPEIALIQSRMILGKTVDDLNLQANITQKYFPLFGRGFARISDAKPAEITISRLFVSGSDNETPELLLSVTGEKDFLINFDGHSFKGKLGELIERNGISLKIDDINAPPGTEFIIKYVSRLKAISELQDKLTV